MGIKPQWVRPEGPLNVWKVIDGFQTLEDGTKKPVKFSIQDIPNDDSRRQEVLDLLYTHFLAEEPMTTSLKIKQSDPDGVADFISIWEYGLDQGVVIGCYKLDSEGNIQELAGCNSMFIVTPETAKDLAKLKENFKSQNTLKIWNFFESLAHEADVCKIYNVDRYISSISLTVNPIYRGQKLGVHILEARSGMAKRYGFNATSTMFTAHASQIQAERAGFEVGISVDYATALDKEGNPMFPNITSKCSKIMMKKFT